MVSLFVEQSDVPGRAAFIFTNLIDFVIFAILLAEIIVGFRQAPQIQVGAGAGEQR